MDTVRQLLKGCRDVLRWQAELGLAGLDDVEELFVPAPAAVSPQGRKEPRPRMSLVEIYRQLGSCNRCQLRSHRTNLVFGTGSAQARLMFVGEAPGRDEDLRSEPFVGAAGELLDRMIRAMGLERREVYIANVIKCRPPNDRDPTPEEIAACEPFLKQQIEAVEPEVLVTLGRCAAQTLLRDTRPLSALRGHWTAFQAIPLLPTFHPAYLLRNERDKPLVWQDLKVVMKKLGLCSAPRR